MATRQFLMHVKYTLSYRIVSHRFSVFSVRPLNRLRQGRLIIVVVSAKSLILTKKKLIIDNEIIRIMLFSDTRRGEV